VKLVWLRPSSIFLKNGKHLSMVQQLMGGKSLVGEHRR
jgi:hypothetical protein